MCGQLQGANPPKLLQLVSEYVADILPPEEKSKEKASSEQEAIKKHDEEGELSEDEEGAGSPGPKKGKKPEEKKAEEKKPEEKKPEEKKTEAKVEEKKAESSAAPAAAAVGAGAAVGGAAAVAASKPEEKKEEKAQSIASATTTAPASARADTKPAVSALFSLHWPSLSVFTLEPPFILPLSKTTRCFGVIPFSEGALLCFFVKRVCLFQDRSFIA